MANSAASSGTEYVGGREVAGGGVEMDKDWSGIADGNDSGRKQAGDVETG